MHVMECANPASRRARTVELLIGERQTASEILAKVAERGHAHACHEGKAVVCGHAHAAIKGHTHATVVWVPERNMSALHVGEHACTQARTLFHRTSSMRTTAAHRTQQKYHNMSSLFS